MAKKIGVCEFIQMAREKHGEKYDYTKSNLVNFSTKIKIVCKKCKEDVGLSRSVFYKRPTDHISGGQGCPRCSKGKSERLFGECLKMVAPHFVFKKVRPKFLRVGSSSLELDFYCKKIDLAFEVNGSQHYEYNNFFHRNYYNFLSLIGRDSIKESLCKENGIKLISVDLRDFSKTNRKEEFLEYIENFFREYKC